MPRVLLLLPKSSYRAQPFLDGAASAAVEVRVASDVCHVLHEAWGTGALTVDFDAPEEAARRIAEACAHDPVDAIVPVTEATALVAALASERLGIPANAPRAAYAARNKRALREALLAAGVPQPAFRVASLDDDPARVAALLPPPCVVKPVLLSASRGVIRADDAPAIVAALARIAAIVASPDLGGLRDADRRAVLVEQFVAGPEVALEGLLTDAPGGAQLRTLALFDKPDPLDGPYFEETIYVTPSRLPAATQERVRAVAEAAARAMGLRTGPVHAELRLRGGDAPCVIEIAARSIGGLCARTLRFDAGMSLEELVVRHAVGEDVGARVPASPREASGVMMIPVPAPGVLEEIDGVSDAAAVAGIEDVVIGAPIGTRLVPLPEGGSYLGFLFARGATPAAVEASLRAAHAKLRFRVAVALS